MINNKKITIIIPFYNEEKHIGRLVQSLPNFIDTVILVNDSSTDKSLEELKKSIIQKEGNAIAIELIFDSDFDEIPEHTSKYYIVHHRENKGKGAAIKSGYKLSLSLNSDCISTIDGDGQMDINELEIVCEPILSDVADYSKGNRLSYPNAKNIIPTNRLLGIYILTFLTRLCSGYWHINDTQTGFTAINPKILRRIDLASVYDYYGYVNDIIVRLSVLKARVVDVPITPIYHSPLDSKMKLHVAAPKIFILMLRLFKWKFIIKLKSLLQSYRLN